MLNEQAAGTHCIEAGETEPGYDLTTVLFRDEGERCDV
jgi:hypothetical protein